MPGRAGPIAHAQDATRNGGRGQRKIDGRSLVPQARRNAIRFSRISQRRSMAADALAALTSTRTSIERSLASVTCRLKTARAGTCAGHRFRRLA
jgi:hypothetical protein